MALSREINDFDQATLTVTADEPTPQIFYSFIDGHPVGHLQTLPVASYIASIKKDQFGTYLVLRNKATGEKFSVDEAVALRRINLKKSFRHGSELVFA